jgi:hypothetical protein
MVEGDQHVHLRVGTLDALIRNIELVARVSSFNEGWILTVTEHAVPRSLQTLGDNRADGIETLPGSADNFDRYTMHHLRSLPLLRRTDQLHCPRSHRFLLAVGLVDDF